MNEKQFKSLSEKEQAHLSSEFRKTVHDGEIIFLDDKNAKSLTALEAKELLIKQRNELLMSLGYEVPDDSGDDLDHPRQGR